MAAVRWLARWAVIALVADATLAGSTDNSTRKPSRRRSSTLTPVTEWTSEDLTRWLEKSTGLKVNAEVAQSLGLHGALLFDGGLSDKDLRAIGIERNEDVEKYRKAVDVLDERITRNPRSFFEWRAANRRFCDFWLLPLSTFSPRLLLVWFYISEENEQPEAGAFSKVEDDVADNKTLTEFILTTIILPHLPIFTVSRKFRTPGVSDTLLQLMAFLRVVEDFIIFLAVASGGYHKGHSRQVLKEELVGLAIAWFGFNILWWISPSAWFDAVLYLYIYVVFPGVLLYRSYFLAREMTMDHPNSRTKRNSVNSNWRANVHNNPMAHVFQAPEQLANKILRFISAEWLASVFWVAALIFLMLALHIWTDHNYDGVITVDDMQYSFDFDSDGDLDSHDVLVAMDLDGDSEVEVEEVGTVLFQGLSCFTYIYLAVHCTIFVIGIQLGKEHVRHETLQMDIREGDIIFDDEKELLGKGTFGEVFRTRKQPWGGWRGATVAVKQLRVDECDEATQEALKKELRAEAVMLASLRHPHIVSFYGVCLDSKLPQLLTELLEGGSLQSRLYGERDKEMQNPLTHSQKRSIARDMASGLMYLHGKDVAHLDLKPENVLLTRDLVAKLCDFGLTRVTRSSIFKIPKVRYGGTPLYMSPEQHMKAFGISTQSDTYSFGMVLNELETRVMPWIAELGNSPSNSSTGQWIIQEIGRKTAAKERPTICSGPISAIVNACWAHEPAERPSMGEVLYGRGDQWLGLADIVDQKLDLQEGLHNDVFFERSNSAQNNFNAMWHGSDAAQATRTRSRGRAKSTSAL